MLSVPFRKRVVSQYNIIRTSLIDNETTPLQVGNGNFAFNVDNTGLQVRFTRLGRCPLLHSCLWANTMDSQYANTYCQTFLPFNTLSSWAWHNDSLPENGYAALRYTSWLDVC